jgi:magnesium transporter
MTPAVPRASPADAAGDTLERLRHAPLDEASHVYLVDETGSPVGQVPIERVLAAPPETRLGDLATEPLEVSLSAPAEAAALLAVEHHTADVAVVNGNRRLLGAIPIAALLALLHEEHVADRLRAGGVGAAHPSPTEENDVRRAMWARFPWLAIGLVGGTLAAGIVGFFEHALEHELALAFFLPLVVYTADAVGTQTETLLVRALAYGPVQLHVQLHREARVGILLGAATGAAATTLLLVVGMSAKVAAIVGLSLAATSLEATLVASVLPLALHRLGADPALASGPIATVVQDLASVAIYLTIASASLAIMP